MKINFEILFNYYFDIPNFLFYPAPQGQCQGQDLHSSHDHTPSITPKNTGCDATLNSKNFPYLVMREINYHTQCGIFIFSWLLVKCILNEIALWNLVHSISLTWLWSPIQYFKKERDRSSVTGRHCFCLVSYKSNATRWLITFILNETKHQSWPRKLSWHQLIQTYAKVR